MIFPRVKHANTKIQIHKYTNTSYDEVTERPNMWYIFEKGIVQGYQNDISMNQTCKYKNTNTQIQHMIKYQKDPTCCIFLKRGLFKDIKNDIPMSQIGEYKNTNLRLTNAKKTQHVVYL